MSAQDPTAPESKSRPSDWPTDIAWGFSDIVNYAVSILCLCSITLTCQSWPEAAQPQFPMFLAWSMSWSIWGVHSSKSKVVALIYLACLAYGVVYGVSSISSTPQDPPAISDGIAV